MEEDLNKKKSHVKRSAGRKAEKKKLKKGDQSKGQELTARQRNPKAFAFHSAVRAHRKFARTQDVQVKKHHIPVVDRAPVEPPPVIVAIVGGPKVGKTTLLRCLIKNYTRQRLTNISGPVTVVTGKKQRITFIEVNNDINSMIDVAKVADVALLLVDATFGIEMEVFEFLEICRAHGSPRIMGVLNHLDMMKDNKSLRRKKKVLKHRFQVELYPGAKLFYLSRMIHNEYSKTEISNLGRFISVMKFRPLAFRSSHPFVLVDRWEDVTNPEHVRLKPKTDRNIVLYGYVRGTPFRQAQNVHIPGCGDFRTSNISLIPDPCPLPDKIKKRSLNTKERRLYAPMSGVGGILFDKDAIYIDLGGSHHGKEKETDAPESKKTILEPLLQLRTTTDEKSSDTKFQVFADKDSSGLVNSKKSEKSREGKNLEVKRRSQSNDHKNKTIKFETVEDRGSVRRKIVWDDSDVEDDETDSEDESADAEQSESGGDDEAVSRKKIKLESSTQRKRELSDDSGSETDLEEDLKKFSHSSKTRNASKTSEDVVVKSSTQRPADNVVLDRVQELLNTFKNKAPETLNASNSDDSDGSRSSDSGSDFLNSNRKTKDKKEESEAALGSDSNDSWKDSDEDDCDNEPISQESPPNSDEEPSGSDSEYQDIDIFDRRKDKSNSNPQEIEEKNYRLEMFKEASNMFFRNQSSASALKRSIYEEDKLQVVKPSQTGKQVGGLFTTAAKASPEDYTADHERVNYSKMYNWEDPKVCEEIRDCFVTGEWSEKESAQKLLKLDDEDEEELYGDFEDLETGDVVKGKDSSKEEEEADTGVNSQESEKKKLTQQEKRMEKKRRLKEMFDSEYDTKGDHFDILKDEMHAQAQLNRSEFEGLDEETRVQYEGFRAGLYVRIEIANMPMEFVQNFDSSYPIIVGGLLDNEQTMGYLKARIKVHRWYPKILKNRDPLIMSLGWRRFQSMMFYCKREDNFRLRSLKYARKYLHAEAQFWGPVTPVSQGFIAIQSLAEKTSEFRIAANGVILETDKSSKIVKKLKLIGYPEKIYTKTAFVKDMFHSDTEVVKFEGVKIQTQSGIRGIIKKSQGRDGVFRATFEDQIKMSDVIILKAWAPVEVSPFCSYIRSLLLPKADKESWVGMRTVGQVKKERQLRGNVNPDHLYTEISERREYIPQPLSIPKQLQKALPYNLKPKIFPQSKPKERVFVIKDPEEVKMDEFMDRLKALAKAKRLKELKDREEKKKKHAKEAATVEKIKAEKTKKRKAQACKLKSQKMSSKKRKM